jgi:hypothetical protein
MNDEPRRASSPNLSEMVLDCEDRAELYKVVKKKGLKTLQNMGFALTPQPLNDGEPIFPQLPEKVSEISNKEVTDLQSTFVTVYSYAKEVRTLAETMAKTYKERADLIRNTIFLKANGNVQERKAKSETNMEYVRFNSKAIEWSFVEKMLAAKCDSLEKARAVCSRDVEFRTTEADQYKRDQNIRNIRMPKNF